MMDLYKFSVGDKVINNCSGVNYEVFKFISGGGICVLWDRDKDEYSMWNAYNNRYFSPLPDVDIGILVSLSHAS